MAEQSRRFVFLDKPIDKFIEDQKEKNTLSKTRRDVTVRRKNGEDFEPSSLRGLICSFNRHLKACKYPCSVIEDSQFEQVRQALEARSKELKKDGKGNKPKAAEAITDEE
ncbi:unnamed protein product, partial [Porites evermanni]